MLVQIGHGFTVEPPIFSAALLRQGYHAVEVRVKQMFARVVVCSPVSDAAADFTVAVKDTALRIVRAQPGCIAAYVEVRDKVVVGTSVWESASAAQRYSREC